MEEEVVFLANLVGDMEDDVRKMSSLSLLALEARTAAGRAPGLLGVAFSIVLVDSQFILPMKHKASDNSNVATGSTLIRDKKGELWNVHVMLWAGSPISTPHASLFSVEGNQCAPSTFVHMEI